jgi:hypothetical protein
MKDLEAITIKYCMSPLFLITYDGIHPDCDCIIKQSSINPLLLILIHPILLGLIIYQDQVHCSKSKLSKQHLI